MSSFIRSFIVVALSSIALGCATPSSDGSIERPGFGGKADIAVGDCDDGKPALCTLAEPSCPSGSIASLQGGCWTCADEDTCEPLGLPRNCDDGTLAVCTIPAPECEADKVVAVQTGCWACVDPFTCE